MNDPPRRQGFAALRPVGCGLAIVLLIVVIVIARRFASRPDDEGQTLSPAMLALAPDTNDRRSPQADSADSASQLRRAVRLKSTDAAAALALLQQIPETADEFPEAQRHIAHILLSAGRDVEAAAVLEKLAPDAPNDLGVNLSLAEIWYRQKQPARALPFAQQAVRLMPDRAQSYLLVAEILDDLSRAFEMVAPLQRAIELDPTSWDAHLLLAYAAVSGGRLDVAEQAVDWCLERRPDDVDARRYRAMVLRASGEPDAALLEIRKALQREPTNLECRLIEADLLMYQRDGTAAYEALLPLYEANQDRGEYLGMLMRAAVMAGHRDKAREYQSRLKDAMRRQDEEY